jgi:hypothetical protein
MNNPIPYEAVNKDYFSFTICDHGAIINFYYNGVPIGTITNGKFVVHHFQRGDQKIPLTIQDLPQPCKFQTIGHLQEHLFNLIESLSIATRK